jgi:hypothetical protein
MRYPSGPYSVISRAGWLAVQHIVAGNGGMCMPLEQSITAGH